MKDPPGYLTRSLGFKSLLKIRHIPLFMCGKLKLLCVLALRHKHTLFIRPCLLKSRIKMLITVEVGKRTDCVLCQNSVTANSSLSGKLSNFLCWKYTHVYTRMHSCMSVSPNTNNVFAFSPFCRERCFLGLSVMLYISGEKEGGIFWGVCS